MIRLYHALVLSKKAKSPFQIPNDMKICANFEGTAKTYFLDETFKIFLTRKERHEGNDLWNWHKHLELPFGPIKDNIRRYR